MELGTLLSLRDIWRQCAGKGNIPANVGTAENLIRVERALKPLAEVQEQPDVKAFLASVASDDAEKPEADILESGKRKWSEALKKRVPFQARKYDMARLPDTLHPKGPPPGGPNLDALFTYMLVLIGQVEG